MALELKDYIQPITEYITDNEETTKEFKRYLLAVIMSDTLQSDYVTSLSIRDITNNFLDNDFDKFIHSVLHIPAKNNDFSLQSLPRIGIKRILVDTLTLMGTTTTYKYLTMQNSRSVLDNCHISADNLITDEDEVDKIFTSFDLTVQNKMEQPDYVSEFIEAYKSRRHKFKIDTGELNADLSKDHSEEGYKKLGYTIADVLIQNLIEEIDTNIRVYFFMIGKGKKITIHITDTIASKVASEGIKMNDCLKNRINFKTSSIEMETLYKECKTFLEFMYK